MLKTLLITALLLAALPAGNMATPAPFDCPVTQTSHNRPAPGVDPFNADSTLHHENGLWVALPENGVLVLGPETEIAFGPLTGWRSTSVQWLRDDGVEGFVIVSGQRLDAESEFSPRTPLSPQRQYVRIGPVKTGLAFPGAGCWEVVGTVGDYSITFVVEVRFVDDVSATPTV